MERTIKWLSPESSLGSMLSALLVHAVLYGAVVLVLGVGYLTHKEAPIGEVEVGYEVLNEPPPEPTKVVQTVARAKEPDAPVETKIKMDSTPKELHDDSSTVAGTQKAQKVATTVGGENDGVATATPYYKIKPKYPRAALVSGNEGWILMKVDINEKGEVENVRIVDGKDRSLFQDEARRAVEKWKYRPFMNKSGKAYRVDSHQVRVDFKLSDA